MSTNTTLGSGGTDVYLGTCSTATRWPPAAVTRPGTVHAAAGPGRGKLLLHRGHESAGAAAGRDDQGVELVYETNYTNNETAASRTTAVRRLRCPT